MGQPITNLLLEVSRWCRVGHGSSSWLCAHSGFQNRANDALRPYENAGVPKGRQRQCGMMMFCGKASFEQRHTLHGPLDCPRTGQDIKLNT